MRNRLKPKCAGLTLVELLVVVAILVLLVAVVLPLAQPALSGRNVREAARQINTVFERARSEAMANRRPTGVMLIQNASNPAQSAELAIVRVPRPFIGILANSRVVAIPNANVDGLGNSGWALEFRDSTGVMSVAEHTTLQRLIRANATGSGIGETFQIQFDFKGPVVNGFRFDGGGSINFVMRQTEFFPATPYTLPNSLNPAGGGAAFRIQREPRRTAASPIELPVGAYIDLALSGVENEITFADPYGRLPTESVKVMFDAEGNLQSVFGNGDMYDPAQSVHLLVARGKNPGIANLAVDAGSLWVATNRSSGRIMTTENLGPTNPVSTSPTETEFDGAVLESRFSVKTGQAMGGR